VAVKEKMACRKHHVFGKSGSALNDNGADGDAHVRTSGTAVSADAADHVALAGNTVPDRNPVCKSSNFYDLAVEFVAWNQWGIDHGLCGLIIGFNMQVGAADASGHDTDFDLMGSGLWLRPVNEFQPGVWTGLV